MDLRQEPLTSCAIKVKEVYQQYEVVSLSELRRQGAARDPRGREPERGDGRCRAALTHVTPRPRTPERVMRAWQWRGSRGRLRRLRRAARSLAAVRRCGSSRSRWTRPSRAAEVSSCWRVSPG